LGRQTAGYLGLRYLDLIGVLIAAKRGGLIDKNTPSSQDWMPSATNSGSG
jgi:predicted nucleic acid-binding protein